jgi:hypothetical protein
MPTYLGDSSVVVVVPRQDRQSLPQATQSLASAPTTAAIADTTSPHARPVAPPHWAEAEYEAGDVGWACA